MGIIIIIINRKESVDRLFIIVTNNETTASKHVNSIAQFLRGLRHFRSYRPRPLYFPSILRWNENPRPVIEEEQYVHGLWPFLVGTLLHVDQLVYILPGATLPIHGHHS